MGPETIMFSHWDNRWNNDSKQTPQCTEYTAHRSFVCLRTFYSQPKKHFNKLDAIETIDTVCWLDTINFPSLVSTHSHIIAVVGGVICHLYENSTFDTWTVDSVYSIVSAWENFICGTVISHSRSQIDGI